MIDANPPSPGFGSRAARAPAALVVAGLAIGGCVTDPSALRAPKTATGPDMPALIIAHRGASGDRPEHTLAAYQLAIEQGAHFVEPDLVITRDGVLIARHENEIGGTTDVADRPAFADRRTTKAIDGRIVTGWFAEDFTLEEIRTLRARERIPGLRRASQAFDGQFGIPTLEEVIALVRSADEARRQAALAAGRPPPAPVGLYPETKHPTYFRSIGLPLEEPLVELLRRTGYDSDAAPVFIQSFETANLRRLRGMTDARLVQLVDDEGAPFDFTMTGDPRTYADLVTPDGLEEIATYAAGIGAAKSLILPRLEDGTSGSPTTLVRDAHAAGLFVHAWTFRAENTFLPADLRSGSDPERHGDLAEELRRFLQAGVDGWFTDHPGIAAQANTP